MNWYSSQRLKITYTRVDKRDWMTVMKLEIGTSQLPKNLDILPTS